MERIFFSVLMCVYNKTRLLHKAIESVLAQSERSWELLVLDNSDTNRENTWKILEEAVRQDERIKIFGSSENVGWAKGASILLGKASGKYMTFLAADDFLLPEALAKVKKEAQEHNPDVLWVGNKFYELEEGILRELGESMPTSQRLLEDREAENIKYVMEHVFYNSFFHYVNVEFLRREKIDYFDFGYGDCAGMTRVLCQADRMLVMDKAAYGLTANTSQSRGTFYWDGDQYIFSDQWNSIKKACMRDGYFSFQDLRYCATVVLKNENGNIYSLAEGGRCVDRFMNSVSRSLEERLGQIKKILENETIQEMAQFMGRFEYEGELLTAIERLFALHPQDGSEALLQQSGWLGKLLNAGYILTPQGIEKRKRIDGAEILEYAQALTDQENNSMFGMGLFLQSANGMEDHVLEKYREYLEIILKTYHEWKNKFVERIWNGIGQGGMLKGNGKVELAAFCKYILEQ